MENVIYLGDIHGNFRFVSWYIKSHKLTDCHIVQVGDFGIGFTPKEEKIELKKLNLILEKFNVNLFAIRGNHDDPSYFDGKFNDHSRIFLMSDYSTHIICDKKHLFVGGAISIDRKHRIAGEDYWENEHFKFDEEEIKKQNDIDVLVTHSAMSFLSPYTINSDVINYCKNDFGLLEQLQEERLLQTKMWDILKENKNNIKLHVYGHFHDNVISYINETKHVLIGVEKFYEHRN